jgi:hypothetical protein
MLLYQDDRNDRDLLKLHEFGVVYQFSKQDL